MMMILLVAGARTRSSEACAPCRLCLADPSREAWKKEQLHSKGGSGAKLAKGASETTRPAITYSKRNSDEFIGSKRNSDEFIGHPNGHNDSDKINVTTISTQE